MTDTKLGLVETAIVSSAIQGAVRDSYLLEGMKGCDTRIFPKPVMIEPKFPEYRLKNLLSDRQEEINLTPVWDNNNHDNLVFLRIWLSLRDKCKWCDFENVWKEILVTKQPLNLIVIANRDEISFFIGVDNSYVLTVENAVKAYFPHCEIDVLKENLISHFTKNTDSRYELSLREYFPQQPYFKNLSLFDQGSLSPISSLYSGCCRINPPEFVFYQILCIGIGSEWKTNIINLLEADHEAGGYGTIGFGASNTAGYGMEDYREGRKKIDPNQTLCAAIVRLGVFSGKDGKEIIKNLSTTIEKFSFGGVPFRYLTEDDYREAFEHRDKVIEMVAKGLAYRNGMILTSGEITQLWHFPPEGVLENPDYKFDRVTGLKAPEHVTKDGVILGYNVYAGETKIVRQADDIRNRHTAIIGLIGKGKSILIENMVLEDIVLLQQSVIVIDPHGDAVKRILPQVSKENAGQTIDFDTADEDYALCWNPFDTSFGQDASKIAEDSVITFRTLYPANAWGPNIEHALYCCFYLLARGENLALPDALTLLSRTRERQKLLDSVLPEIDNAEVEFFWTNEFPRMSAGEIRRITSKISAFLSHKVIGRIFSQRINKFNFRGIIDEPCLFLAHVPAGLLGTTGANIICSMLFTAFHNAGMARADTSPERRVPAAIYVDEFQRHPQKTSLEDSLRELRKYNIRLVLGLQQREELPLTTKTALSNVGTMIILETSWEDAHRLFRDCYGLVEAGDFLRKNVGAGYVKMGQDVMSINTYPPNEITGKGSSKEIIKLSRERYYVPVGELKPIVSEEEVKPDFGMYDEV